MTRVRRWRAIAFDFLITLAALIVAWKALATLGLFSR